MNRITKTIACAAGVTLVGAGLGSAPVQAVAADNGQDLKLKPTAGRFNDDGKRLGGGKAAKARWTNNESHTGRFSVVLKKKVPTTEAAFAAAIVKRVDEMTVAELGSIGFWVKGSCTGGSPRFNLGYDTDGDGDRDGTAFYGCGNHVSGTDGEWTEMTVASALVADSGPVPATATVLSLAVLVDEEGTYYVDDVTVAGESLGEPND